MIVKIYIGNDLLDLHKDESISVTSSVLSIEDVTKNTTDYTKSFTVPASDNNNQIFKHYYNANIDNTFDARIKVDGRIELDGIPFRIGKFLLQKVKVKQGKPSSYTINFWGNLVSISDSVGKDELSVLDLSAFNHDYNGNNVKLGLESSLKNGDVIYNLLAKKQYYYNSTVNNYTNTDTLANIAYSATGDNGVKFDELKPSLKLIRIIEAIENDYNLTFSRDFFGRSEFTELFMWLNATNTTSGGGGSTLVDFNGGENTYVDFTSNVGFYETRGILNAEGILYFVNTLYVTPLEGYESVPYTIKAYEQNGNILLAQRTITPVGNNLTIGSLEITLRDDVEIYREFEIYYEIESDSSFEYSASLRQVVYEDVILDILTTTASSSIVTSIGDITRNMPKMKIIDFLKGIFQMFKLVVIPQDDGTIYVNTLKDYYLQGSLYDVTNYINFDTYDVARGNILSEIKYSFQDPITILNKQFKENNGIAYGDLEAIIKDQVTGEVLDGDTVDITLPFEQFIYDRLIDVKDGSLTNIVYSPIVDNEIKSVNPKPHIFYNIKTNIGATNILFIRENDTVQLSGTINAPSHVDNLETKNFSTVFGNEFNEYDGVKIENTLYSNYHQEYINNLFNIKRRNFSFNASIIPLSILLKLELNDMLKIGSDYFRIDSFTTDLVTGKTEFNLVNSFDYTLGGFSTSTTNISLTKDAQIYSAYVTNLGNYSVTKIDTGFGIGWIDVTDDGNGNLLFTVTENTLLRRNIFIDITNTDTNQVIRFYVQQDGIVVRADNTTLTADTTLITADYV